MVTIAIASFHYGHLVAQAIESVLWQTQKPDEILVVDDGAGDLPDLFHLYGIVPTVRKKNLGIIENFNDILFNMVETERVLFLGADNWLHPRAIELMSQEEADIVSCDAFIVGEGVYRRWTLHHQPHGSALYDVGKAKEVGGYEASGREHTEEDSVMFKKMMDRGASFYRVDRPLLYYRKHAHNFNK